MHETVTVLLYAVGKEPTQVTIPNELEALQGLVGGDIESLRLFDDVCLICNEEGKTHNLPRNRLVRGDIIVGDFFITTADEEGDYVNLTPEQLSAALSFMEAPTCPYCIEPVLPGEPFTDGATQRFHCECLIHIGIAPVCRDHLMAAAYFDEPEEQAEAATG